MPTTCQPETGRFRTPAFTSNFTAIGSLTPAYDATSLSRTLSVEALVKVRSASPTGRRRKVEKRLREMFTVRGKPWRMRWKVGDPLLSRFTACRLTTFSGVVASRKLCLSTRIAQ